MTKLGTLKNNKINLVDIVGVDIDNLTYNRPPDAFNPKDKVREEVLELLNNAKSPDDLPPIEVTLDSQGMLKIVDGEHRVINNLRKAKMTGDDTWLKIKAYKTESKNESEYLARSIVLSLEESSGKLTDAETFKAVSRIFALSNSKDEVLDLLGHNNKRIVNVVEKVINDSIPDVANAVKSKNVSLDTASKISKAPVENQKVLVDTAVALKVNGKTDTEINKSLGLRKPKSKLMSFTDAVDYALPYFEAFSTGYEEWKDQKDQKNSKNLDEFVDSETITIFETICVFFGISENTMESRLEFFQVLEDLEQEKQKKARRK